jgi:hypothetical protein
MKDAAPGQAVAPNTTGPGSLPAKCHPTFPGDGLPPDKAIDRFGVFGVRLYSVLREKLFCKIFDGRMLLNPDLQALDVD